MQRDQPGTDQSADSASVRDIAAILAIVPATMAADARSHVPLLLTTARGGGMSNIRRLAYVLATAHYEAHFGATLIEQPVRDAEPGTPLGIARGNTAPGDSVRFRGRGYVRVAGRAAYAAWSRRLSLPDVFEDGVTQPYFIAQPDAMADRSFATRIFVRGLRDGIFTGVALGTYINDRRTDYLGARRVVADDGRGAEVAALAAGYYDALAGAHEMRPGEPAERAQHADLTGAIERLARSGYSLPRPRSIVTWKGETRQGRFVRIDEARCALHAGHGEYVVVDIVRDLGGVVPPEATNLVLRRDVS